MFQYDNMLETKSLLKKTNPSKQAFKLMLQTYIV